MDKKTTQKVATAILVLFALVVAIIFIYLFATNQGMFWSLFGILAVFGGFGAVVWAIFNYE